MRSTNSNENNLGDDFFTIKKLKLTYQYMTLLQSNPHTTYLQIT